MAATSWVWRPPAARSTSRCLIFSSFRNGILVEHWALLDNLGLLRQIGVTAI